MRQASDLRPACEPALLLVADACVPDPSMTGLSFGNDLSGAGGTARQVDDIALTESELRLRLALEATGVGIFDYDLVDGSLVWDARTREMFGIGAHDPVSYEGTFLPGVHPEDRDRADRAVKEAIDPKGSGAFDCEYRTVAPDGTPLRRLAARGRLVVENGTASRFVGTVRDVTEERNAQEAIRATQERYRLVTRATNDAIWDWDLVKDHVLWNEALCTAYGWEPHRVDPTGAWWLAQIHPEDRARVEHDIRSVIAGTDSDWSHEYRFARADGTYADVLDRGYMVRSPAGTPLRMIGAMLDLTERNRAEGRLRAVFETANVGIVELDPTTLKALRVNAKLCAIWGASEEEIVGRSVACWTPDEDAAERDRLHRRLAAGEIMRETLEKRYRRKDGRLIWARVNLVAQMRAGEMQTTAMIEDITAEKFADEAQNALIALVDRLRDARMPAEAGAVAAEILGRTVGADRAGFAAIDAGAGTVAIERDWTAGTLSSLAGTYPLASFAATLAAMRRGEPLIVGAASAGAETGTPIAARAQVNVPLTRNGDLVGWLYAHAREPRDWTPGEIEFARKVVERVWVTLAQLRADEQQRFLNRELSHRLKNTLTMAQAIVAQTLRNAPSLDEAKEALVARLIALGKAHDLLLEGETESAEMDAIITDALAIHDDSAPGRFRLDGPPILIGPKAALALSLMMHELGTNAAKYGALSRPDGCVSVAWSLDGDDRDPTVRLCWAESGGPPVAMPARKGFGSRLIERGLSGAVGGETVVDFAPDGVICRISAPLSGFLSRD